MRTISRKSVLLVAVAVGSILAAAAPASAAPAGSAHVRFPDGKAWRIALKVAGSSFPTFTAATVASGSSAWAFLGSGGAPRAYRLTGSTWARRSFPGTSGDQVVAASSPSATDVWAFTFQGRVLHYNGSRWSTVKKFPTGKVINSGLAVSSKDAWVFGENFGPALGTWHYNGSKWTKVTSGAGLAGGSALSANSIWAYGGTNVAHWDGHRWTKTSVKSLLPKNTQLSHSFVAGIYPVSGTDIYAVASGGRQDEGGPVVLLQDNGSGWKKVASRQTGGPVSLVPDGSGGFWIPITAAESSSMLHYSHGAFSKVTLPFSPAHLLLFGAANARSGSSALAVGFSRKSFSSTTSTAVILRYGF